MGRRVQDFGSSWHMFGLTLVVLWGCFLLKPLDALAPASFEAFYFSQGATMFLLAFCVSRNQTRHMVFVDIIFAALMLIAPFLALFPHAQFYDLSFVASGAFGGSSWAWFLARWFAIYAKFPVRRMMPYMLGSFALMPVLRIPLEFLPLEWGVGIASIIPLAMVPLLRRAHESASEAVGDTASTMVSSRANLKLIVAELAVYGVAVGLFRVNADTSHVAWQVTSVSLIVKSAVPLLLLGLVHFARSRVSINLICQFALAFILVAIAIASSQWENAEVSFAIFDCMRQAMYILLFFVLGALSLKTSAQPEVLFGIGWGSYTAAVGLGMVVADTLGTVGIHFSAFAVHLACILSISVILVFVLKDNVDVQLFSDKRPEDPLPIQNLEEMNRRCSALAERHGLTNREVDVMKLICSGRSKRYIAEHLIISENTVRGYAKSLYLKLGIHNRQELMDELGLKDI